MKKKWYCECGCSELPEKEVSKVTDIEPKTAQELIDAAVQYEAAGDQATAVELFRRARQMEDAEGVQAAEEE